MVSMKIFYGVFVAFSITSSATAVASRAAVSGSPIQKVVQLLSDMMSKRIKEGEVEQGAFEQFSRWCERTAWEKQNTIADFKEQVTALTATLDTATSNIEELSVVIENLSNSISSNEEQLKESTKLRKQEHKDFLKENADLGSTIDMLGRAHAVIKQHLSDPNAALIDTSMQKALSGLRSIVDASFVNVQDRQVLVALLQQSQGEDAQSLDLAPQGSTKALESKSGPILDTIENMKEKAEAAQNELQKAEMKTQHAFEMLAQSLKDETASLNKQLASAKMKKNTNMEAKATSSGQLEIVTKDLASDEKYLSDLQKECMEKADAFETGQAERAAEIKVLMMAKKILVAAGKGAFVQESTDDSDENPSFLQTSSKTKTKALNTLRLHQEWQTQAADYLIRQGDRLNSWVLSQVGSHVQADPFEKVKNMIQQMIQKLVEEQAEEASHKAWCDSELTKTKKAKKSKSSKVEELATRIEKSQSLSDKLGEQIKMLGMELADMEDAAGKAMEMRQAENKEFLHNKKELDSALAATSMAIKVLRDYYSGKSFVQQGSDTMSMSSLMQEREQSTQQSSESDESSEEQPKGSAAASVIGMLEVAESDFQKAIAEIQAAEDAAQSEYDGMVQDGKVSSAEKMQDQKNKKAESTRLDNMVAETKLDHKDSNDELNAILEYLDKLKGSCETKAPSFEERQKRRQQEMEGLQNALAILEGKAIALLDTGADNTGSFSDSATLLRR